MTTGKRRKAPPRAPKHHRLTEGKRIIIETPRKEGCSKEHMAESAGCHPATVGRELRRNVGKKGCRHGKAQGKADRRAAEKAAKRRRFTPEMWTLAMEEEMRRIDCTLNDRPLRRLNWRTPREAFAEPFRRHMLSAA